MSLKRYIIFIGGICNQLVNNYLKDFSDEEITIARKAMKIQNSFISRLQKSKKP